MSLALAKKAATVAYLLNESSGNAVDAVGNRDMTDNGTVGTTTGKLGTARNFVKVNSEYFSVAHELNINSFDGASASFTITCWVKLADKTTNYTVVGKGNVSDEIGIFYISSTDRFRFDAAGGIVTANNFGSPTAGQWHLIVCGYDAVNDVFFISVDGSAKDTDSDSSGPVSNASNPFLIGAFRTTPSSLMNGAIDEVVVMRDYVFTTQDITDLWNSGTGVSFKEWDEEVDTVRGLARASHYVVANWPLNESSGNALESTGSGALDLTDVNTVGSTAGLFGTARDFENGNNEQFTHLDHPTLRVDNQTDFCIVAWVKPESVGATRWILAKGNIGTAANIPYSLNITSGNKARFVVGNGTTSGEVSSTESISAATQYLLVAKHDAKNNEIGISVNGAAYTIVPYSGGSHSETAKFIIGDLTDIFAIPFDGIIEDVSLIKNYILDEDELVELWNGGTGVPFDEWDGTATVAPTGLALAKTYAVAHWPLDETSGARIDDVGGNTLVDNGTVGCAAGKFGQAADFEIANGDEYLSIADVANLSADDVDFMIRCWVKLESKPGSTMIIAIKGTVDGPQEEYFLAHSSADRFIFLANNGAGTRTTVTANNLGSPSTDTWYLLHAWHDTTNNQIGISVNAGTANTAAHSGGVRSGTGSFKIGIDDPGSRLYDGLIEDVVILKNYILTAAERTEDYNSGNGIRFVDWGVEEAEPAPTGLSLAKTYAVAHWSLNETSGARVDDVGGNTLVDNNTVGCAAGKFGQAADFELDNSESLSSVSTSDLQTGDIDWMIRLWFKPESFGTSNQSLMTKGAGFLNVTVTEYYIRQRHDVHDIQFVVLDTSSNEGIVSSGTESITTGSWHLLHVWHDATNNQIGIAINAGTAVTTSWSAGVRTNSQDFHIGKILQDLTTPGGFFDGLIEDVVILKGYILNASERTEDYNSGNGVRFADW